MECPICHEGNHSGRKRRAYFFPDEKYFFCHNCNQSWKPLQWLQEVTGESTEEILRKGDTFTQIVDPFEKDLPVVVPEKEEDLPGLCIDLFREEDHHLVPPSVLNYIRKRRITQALFRPQSLYYCLEGDRVHEKRLIIPFYDYVTPNKIVSYQSRCLDPRSERPKYLTKYGEKYLYGLECLNPSIPCLFVLEGPIDAMFVPNGIAIGGAKMTSSQEQLLQTLKLQYSEIIWILDNDKNNEEMKGRFQQLVHQGEKVFIWPKELKEFKDINDVCMATERDFIGTKFLLSNSFRGLEATLKRK